VGRKMCRPDSKGDNFGLDDEPLSFGIDYSNQRGRGLYAIRDIEPHTTLHVAPTILVKQSEYDQFMRHTILEHYLFNAPAHGDKLMALGYGSLFNHSDTPNTDYRVVKQFRGAEAEYVILYRSGSRPIKSGEELCIYYGSSLWFKNDEPIKAGDSSQVAQTNETDNDTILGFLNFLQLDDD
jgi:SET domain